MLEIAATRFINAFVLPPGGLIVLLFLSYWLLTRREILARRLLIISSTLLLLLSLPIVAENLIKPLESYPAVTAKKIKQLQPQAIVILAGGRDEYAPEYGGVTINEYTLRRLIYGVKLHRQTQLPMLVTGGNAKPNLPAEAILMQQRLQQEFGLSAKWVEDKSRNTAENALFSEKILTHEKIDRILLVTHAWHLGRAVPIFERQGLKVLPAPTKYAGFYRSIKLLDFLPDAGAFKKSYHAIHEYVGLAWYSLRY